MLRFILGDKLFWKAINYYVTKNQFKPVETNDLKLAVEEATGQNLYWFFDEWVYKAGHPIFNVSYKWNDSSKSIFLSVKQMQKMDSLTGVFKMPVDIEVTTNSGSITTRINIASKDSIFIIPSKEKPNLIIFDKGNYLIKELKFEKSIDEWKTQAEFAINPIDRIRALQELTKDSNKVNYVALFSKIALQDKFWAVRSEAISSLGKIETKDDNIKQQISSTLIDAYKDGKSDVRNRAINELGKYRGNNVVETLHNALKDSSYTIMSSALRSLAKADSTNAIPLFTAYIDTPSYRSTVCNTALNQLAKFDSAKAISISIKKTQYGTPIWERNTALDILAKYGKNREEIKTLFTSLLNDKNGGIKATAARTLGNIGDESVIPLLEKIANDTEDPANETAKSSIEKIKKKKTESK